MNFVQKSRSVRLFFSWGNIMTRGRVARKRDVTWKSWSVGLLSGYAARALPGGVDLILSRAHADS
jgi:hypothetical protein